MELSHRNVEILERASAELASELETFSVTRDVIDGYELGKRQVDFQILSRGKSLG